MGCAYVLRGGRVTLTVAGVVETRGPRRLVEIHILDMRRSEDVLAFEAELAVEDEGELASAVARLVASVVDGASRLVGDIRAMEDPDADLEADRDRAVAAAQLDSLSKEIGGAESVDILDEGEVVREKITVDDLSEQIASEAAKPWERLGMRVTEYVKYRNSGLNLAQWRDLVAGRRGQLVVRGGLGWATGPSNGGYYFLEAKAAADLQVVETWAWANATTGQGLNWEVDVAYGLLPSVELGLVMGGLTGQYSVQSWNFTEGQTLREPDPAQTSSAVTYLGPQVLFALLPTSQVRPVVGGEVRYWLGTSVLDHVESAALPADAPTFEDTWMLTAGGRVGVEATLGESFDFTCMRLRRCWSRWTPSPASSEATATSRRLYSPSQSEGWGSDSRPACSSASSEEPRSQRPSASTWTQTEVMRRQPRGGG